MTDYQTVFLIILSVVRSLDIKLFYMGRSLFDTHGSMIALKKISAHHFEF